MEGRVQIILGTKVGSLKALMDICAMKYGVGNYTIEWNVSCPLSLPNHCLRVLFPGS